MSSVCVVALYIYLRVCVSSEPVVTDKTSRECSKCGILKSGKSSCCGRGGSWFGKCANKVNNKFSYTWSEGIESCQTESESAYASECMICLRILLVRYLGSLSVCFTRPQNHQSHRSQKQRSRIVPNVALSSPANPAVAVAVALGLRSVVLTKNRVLITRGVKAFGRAKVRRYLCVCSSLDLLVEIRALIVRLAMMLTECSLSMEPFINITEDPRHSFMLWNCPDSGLISASSTLLYRSPDYKIMVEVGVHPATPQSAWLNLTCEIHSRLELSFAESRMDSVEGQNSQTSQTSQNQYKFKS